MPDSENLKPETAASAPRTAFVLGAGLGTRLRPLTDELPKPMLPVGGRPMIESCFERLRAAGVRRIIVNTHWKPEAYERTYPEHHHHHVICRVCGKMEPLPGCQAAFFENIAGKLGYTDLTHVLEVFGVCPACAQAQTKTKH